MFVLFQAEYLQERSVSSWPARVNRFPPVREGNHDIWSGGLDIGVFWTRGEDGRMDSEGV